MLYLKFMSGENLADNESTKGFMLVTVGSNDRLLFGTDSVGPAGEAHHDPNVLRVVRADGTSEDYAMTGNVYVMNQAGKTIQTCAMR